MLDQTFNKLQTLRFRILGSIFLVFSLSLALALYGMWTYQRTKVVGLARNEAQQVGQTIKAGLRASMLQNDRLAVEKTIGEMADGINISTISILDLGGRVRMASDPLLVGRQYNKEKECSVCHVGSGLVPGRDNVVVEEGGKPILRKIIKIENLPECHQCHAAEQKLCGILMVDSSLAGSYAILKTMALRAIFTGLLTFLIIALLVSYVISRFVTNPLQALLKGFYRVGQGDFDYWVDAKGSDEITEIADTFNVMSRAVGRYIDELASKSEEISTLYTIVQRMSQTIDGKKLKHIVIDLLLEIFKARTVVLIVPADVAGGVYEVFSGESGSRQHQQDKFDLAGSVDPHPAVSRAEVEQWQAAGFAQPLFADGGCKTLISIQMQDMRFALVCAVKDEGRSFSMAEKKIFPALIHHIAISFANSRLYTMAITDGLTGLYTKRYLNTIASELHEKSSSGEPGDGFCLMMVDIDHFKEVNDQYGHQVGDRVLLEMADVIRAGLRTADIPCRYGGEEFVLILPGTDVETGCMVAERLRAAIAEHAFMVDADLVLHKTISIGLACGSLAVASVDEMIRQADEALYVAKRQGRNRIEVCRLPQPIVPE
ncbi:MAG: diguanylate cyclase [Desulfobulbaceae bacterium]|nr:diguanylate cyclase [Desulfobulbaceae bacterium]